MAADGVNKLKLQLVHGQQKHDIVLELPGEEAGEVLTVAKLAKKAEESTGVPLKGQRLIYKGKSLTNLESRLSDLGMKDKSKVMLIGRKANAEDDANMKKLKNLESDISKTEKKLSDVTYELDGVHRGFAPENMKTEILTRLSKSLAAIIEDFMKLLEKLDGVELTEGAVEGKAKRKAAVNRIQELLKRSDGLAHGLNEMIALRS